jgi:hypothetical protein
MVPQGALGAGGMWRVTKDAHFTVFRIAGDSFGPDFGGAGNREVVSGLNKARAANGGISHSGTQQPDG